MATKFEIISRGCARAAGVSYGASLRLAWQGERPTITVEPASSPVNETERRTYGSFALNREVAVEGGEVWLAIASRWSESSIETTHRCEVVASQGIEIERWGIDLDQAVDAWYRGAYGPAGEFLSARLSGRALKNFNRAAGWQGGPKAWRIPVLRATAGALGLDHARIGGNADRALVELAELAGAIFPPHPTPFGDTNIILPPGEWMVEEIPLELAPEEEHRRRDNW